MAKRSVQVALPLALLLSAGAAHAQNPLITLRENGVGSLLFPAIPSVPLTGIIRADPGPGGLPNALTFDLLGPPSLVAGDLIMQELVGASLVTSDVIRFNPAGTGGVVSYPASVVFYSDNLDGADALADTGFPASNYTNVLFVTEVGPEGNNGFVYTPTANQPGFVAGFAVSYNIISDEVQIPEPMSASLIVIGGGLYFGLSRLRKARARAPSLRPH